VHTPFLAERYRKPRTGPHSRQRTNAGVATPNERRCPKRRSGALDGSPARSGACGSTKARDMANPSEFDSGLSLGLVLAREFRRHGLLPPVRLLERSRGPRVGDEALSPCLVLVEDPRSCLLIWDRERQPHLLDPYCCRFSAPVVEKVFQKRSKILGLRRCQDQLSRPC
jgi:hypothetical protein